MLNSKSANEYCSAVIAAYNEEQTVGSVVRTLVSSGLFQEVIVVSDGSTDDTARIAECNGGKVFQLRKNGGKGHAIKYGVSRTKSEIIFLCDADLIGFKPEHISLLLDPVLRRRMVMCVGLRDRGPWFTAAGRLLPLIGGERALERRVIDGIPEKFVRDYMLETALNYFCRSNRMPYGSVALPGLRIRRKIQKMGFLRGLKGYFVMAAQIVKAAIDVRWARLIGQF